MTFGYLMLEITIFLFILFYNYFKNLTIYVKQNIKKLIVMKGIKNFKFCIILNR